MCQCISAIDSLKTHFDKWIEMLLWLMPRLSAISMPLFFFQAGKWRSCYLPANNTIVQYMHVHKNCLPTVVFANKYNPGGSLGKPKKTVRSLMAWWWCAVANTYMIAQNLLLLAVALELFFGWGGTHLQGRRNPPTPKFMLLFGFRPLYFGKLKKLIFL